MKINIILTYLLLLGIGIFTSCKKDDPSPADKKMNLMTHNGKAWTVKSVTENGAAAPTWSTFKVTFGKGTYTTSGSRHLNVWPESGTWEFVNENTYDIRRNDGTIINVTFQDNNKVMRMGFQIPYNVSAVKESSLLRGIGGTYVFEMQ